MSVWFFDTPPILTKKGINFLWKYQNPENSDSGIPGSGAQIHNSRLIICYKNIGFTTNFEGNKSKNCFKTCNMICFKIYSTILKWNLVKEFCLYLIFLRIVFQMFRNNWKDIMRLNYPDLRWQLSPISWAFMLLYFLNQYYFADDSYANVRGQGSQQNFSLNLF